MGRMALRLVTFVSLFCVIAGSEEMKFAPSRTSTKPPLPYLNYKGNGNVELAVKMLLLAPGYEEHLKDQMSILPWKTNNPMAETLLEVAKDAREEFRSGFKAPPSADAVRRLCNLTKGDESIAEAIKCITTQMTTAANEPFSIKVNETSVCDDKGMCQNTTYHQPYVEVFLGNILGAISRHPDGIPASTLYIHALMKPAGLYMHLPKHVDVGKRRFVLSAMVANSRDSGLVIIPKEKEYLELRYYDNYGNCHELEYVTVWTGKAVDHYRTEDTCNFGGFHSALYVALEEVPSQN